VFGGCDAIIHVVSVADGNEVKGVDSGAYIAGSAAYLEGHVYVGNYEGEFIKVDVESGEVLWRYGDKESPFLSSPAIGHEEVVFGGQDSIVHCVGRDDGKPIWTFKTLAEVDGSPAICADKVVAGSLDGRLYMIRLSDGSRVWSYEIGQPIGSSPAVSNGVVVVGCEDGYIYAFGPDRSGRDGK
jgi:outer membrane protein assembly factor BamB